ncbi:hypothetical protein TcG_13146 [Trypanosoma cruzi]|nr:hypothetical protein TcG_13146 [Trypanosoma cruzi]
MSSRSHPENVLRYACVSCVRTFHSHRCMYMRLRKCNKHTSNQYYPSGGPHRQPTQEELFASEIPPISNKKSNGVGTAYAYGERDPLKWMFSIGHPMLSAGHAEGSVVASQRNAVHTANP